MITLPVVGRIQGAMLEPRGTPERMVVLVQYNSQKGELCELEMPLGDAMYLLNILREIEKDPRNSAK